MEKNDLSYYWSCLFMKQKPSNFGGYNIYMIEQWLVKYQSYQQILIEIGKYPLLSKKQHFLFLQSKLPKGLPRFLKEIDENKDKDKIQNMVQRFYKCSRKDSIDYMKFLDIIELSEIIGFYEEMEIIKK